MTHEAWIWLGIALTIAGAGVNAALDEWLHTLAGAWPAKARVLVALRWAVICGAGTFAFLIDSGRLPYSEPLLWVLLLAAGLVVVVAGIMTHNGGNTGG